jgi:AraC-like DNA-binding protein
LFDAQATRSELEQTLCEASVGLYDQSQLHRHFKRTFGMTPGSYAQAMR